MSEPHELKRGDLIRVTQNDVTQIYRVDGATPLEPDGYSLRLFPVGFPEREVSRYGNGEVGRWRSAAESRPCPEPGCPATAGQSCVSPSGYKRWPHTKRAERENTPRDDEPCGAVFAGKPGQRPCTKPAGHEHGPDADWKRDLHSNGKLKWRVDGADVVPSDTAGFWAREAQRIQDELGGTFDKFAAKRPDGVEVWTFSWTPPAPGAVTRKCRYCGQVIHWRDGVWLDDTNHRPCPAWNAPDAPRVEHEP